jgi:hypothetical protein
VKAFVNFARTVGQEMDKLAKTARGLEVDFQFMQKMEFVTKNAGVEMGVLETALRNASRRVGEMNLGIGNAEKNFARLGMSTESFIDLNPQEQFLKIMKAIDSVQDPNERMAISMSIFEEMGPKVVQLARGVQEYGEAWTKTGHNITDSQAESMRELNEQIIRTDSAWRRLKVTSAEAYGTETLRFVEKLAIAGAWYTRFWVGDGVNEFLTHKASTISPKGVWGKNLKALSPWEKKEKEEKRKQDLLKNKMERDRLLGEKLERQAASHREAKAKRDQWGEDGPWQTRIRQEEEKLALMKKQAANSDMLPGAYEKGQAATISLLNNISSANTLAEEKKFRKDSIKVQEAQLKELKKRFRDEKWLADEHERVAKIL